MTSNSTTSTPRRYRQLAAALATLLAGSCGGNGSNPISPTGANRAPQIAAVVVDPSRVEAGGTANVTVTAQDPDGDELTFQFLAENGTVASMAPSRALYKNSGNGQTSDRIRVRAADRFGAVAESVQSLEVLPPPRPKPSPGQTPTPNPGPTPGPTPGPGPTPNPSPTLPPPSPPTSQNRPPTVSASADAGQCHPRPGAPCGITVRASGTDPDGDALSYSWSGCAGGAGATAACSVGSPGAATAFVTVSDGRGGSASASATVSGANSAPSVSVSGGGACHPPCSASLSASASDADGDSLSYSWTGCSGSGASCQVNINSVGSTTSTVTVSDGWDSRSASAISTGTNQSPTGTLNAFEMQAALTSTFNWSVNDDDASGGSCSGGASGQCNFISVACPASAPGSGTIRVRGTGGGTCAINVHYTDRWGAGVTLSSTVPVAPAEPPCNPICPVK